jgi:DNA-binding Lrp family transcriptional regulator
MSVENPFNVKRFGEGRLDSKDRRILEAVYQSGTLKFNVLAERVKTEVSRATLVGRLEKLVRLGYLEKQRLEADRRSVAITLNPLAQILMLTVEQARSRLQALGAELGRLKATQAHGEGLVGFLKEASSRLSSAYSMTTSIALMFGVDAATEVFLPMLVEEYRKLAQDLTQLFRRSPAAAREYLQSVFTRESVDQLRGVSLSLEKKGLHELAKLVDLFLTQYGSK